MILSGAGPTAAHEEVYEVKNTLTNISCKVQSHEPVFHGKWVFVNVAAINGMLKTALIGPCSSRLISSHIQEFQAP